MKKILFCIAFVAGSYLGYSQCAPILAPWLEDVEGMSCQQSFTPQQCWTETSPNFSVRWGVDCNGSTPSSSTGPSMGAHGGSHYFYLETSGGGAGITAEIVSPEISIVALAKPALKFWHHMFGTDMGDMTIEIWDGANWNPELTISGQQQTSGSEAWKRTIIKLDAYLAAGQDTIKVKFIGSDKNTNFRGDMCVDDIEIFDCTPSFNTVNDDVCGYYTLGSGKQVYGSGTFIDTSENAVGCDSIVTYNLTGLNTYSTIFPIACGTYISPAGVKLGTPGTYIDTIDNAAGCDSVITINLTSNNTFNNYSTTACNVFTAPSGATYTVSGTYADTIKNAVNCDSIMVIDVVVNYNDNQTIFITTCGECYVSEAGTSYCSTGVFTESYQTIHGCDSTLYIDVSIAEGNSVELDISACDEFTSDGGNTYKNSGTYVEQYVGQTGCDSTITYNLTISTVDPSIYIGSPATVLVANQSGASYQWIDCNSGNPISGAVGQSYTASLNGDYACEVTNNNCTEMSECIRIGTASVNEVVNSFELFPNPSNGMFTIELNDLTDNTLVEVTNVAGQVIYSVNASSTRTNINLEDVEAGMYVVTITNASSKARQSIVIE